MKNKIGRVIIFFSLLLLFWLALSPVANAQTPTPPPTRELLIQAIQLRAQKDVELGAVPQSPTDLAVLFGEQAIVVGMSMNEVKDIYDEAYKTATPAKSPWDDLLKPQGGWIFLIIGGLLVILANIAKDYLTAFGKKIAEGAYQKLARFRPFWMIALRRYRKSLEATYRELKIPFRSGRPLQMQDVYVPLRVDGGNKEQVDAYQTIQQNKRLVILGDPGSGKTMLLRHIAFMYAKQGLYDFPGHPIPVYLELNRVEGSGDSLFNALTKTLENHNFPGAEGFLKSAFENASLLILLDGLDEVNAPSRPAIVKQIEDLWQKYPENRIIVTCRKAAYQGEVDGWADQKLEIIEFSDQQIQRFMTSWQKDMQPDKSIEHFIRTLHERPQIMALARNPLLLTMVAYLYTDTEFALPHSRSEFYSRSTDLLLDQWKLDRNRYKATHKRIVLQRLALFNQTESEKTGERRTMELADVLKEVRDVLPDLTLKTEDAQPLLDEIVLRSGLMLTMDGGQRYQFTHLTLQEYFAARALESEPTRLLESYKVNPDAWREVMRLWCALEHDSTAVLKDLYTLNPLMAFECLSDAQKVDATYADELIQSFQPLLNEAVTNDSLANAFALLAADPRKRGKTWFEFLKSSLNDEHNRLATSTVLARTNIPQAAEALAKIAETEPTVIPFLIQLGNLAIPALTEPAQNGLIWAMDALTDIGTPQAALALQPLLWTDKGSAYQAAWRLAALLPLAGVEDELKTVQVTPEQLKAKQIEWIWEPFSDDASLRAVVGRITYLIDTALEEHFPTKMLLCDLRLALPMCAVVKNVYQNLEEDNREKLCEQIMEAEKSLPVLDNLELRQPKPENEKQKFIVNECLNQLSENKVLQRIYSALPTVRQFDLLRLLALGNVSPSEDDWRNLFKPVSYNFSTSWHVKALKLMLVLLMILNLGGIGAYISQSAMLFTWVNTGIALIGIALLAGIIWIQRQIWDLYNMEEWVLFASLGTGTTFGAIAGELSHNWLVGALLGALFNGLLCSLSMSVLQNATVDRKRLNELLGIALGVVLGGTLVGTLGGTLVGALGGTLVGTLFAIIGFTVTLFVTHGVEDWVRRLFSTLGPILGGALIGTVAGMIFGIPSLTLTYFSTKLFYNLAGFPITVMFWMGWWGAFYLLYMIGKRLERRAQNPLHGLLEPSGVAISLQHSSNLIRRWLWFR